MAIAKKGGATVESGFKVPREKLASVVSSLDEDEEASAASGIDELGSSASNVSRNNVQRRYRESCASEAYVSGTSSNSFFFSYSRIHYYNQLQHCDCFCYGLCCYIVTQYEFYDNNSTCTSYGLNWTQI